MIKEIIVEEVIAAHELQSPDNKVYCPRCRQQDLVLTGSMQRPYEETLSKGEIVSSKLDEDTLMQEIEVVECLLCRKRFLVRTDSEFLLEKKLLECAGLLLKGTGHDFLGQGRPC